MAANNEEDLSPTLFSSDRKKTRLNSSSKRLCLQSALPIKQAGAKSSFLVITESPQQSSTTLTSAGKVMDNIPGPSTCHTKGKKHFKQPNDNQLVDNAENKENTLSEIADVESDLQAENDYESDDDFRTNEMEPRPANSNAKMNYLITYSGADVLKIKDREAFAEFVLQHFRDPKDEHDIVDKWAVSAETHLQTRGFHYHMALGLNVQRRWKEIAARMRKEGVPCDFRESGGSYYDIFNYIQKYDSHLITSQGHEGLINPVPKTANAIRARRRSGSSGGGPRTKPNAKKEKRLDLDVVHDLVVQNNLRTDKELALFANKLAKDGKRDLQRWLLSHPSPKSRNDFLSTVWLMQDAVEESSRSNKTLIQLLEECLGAEHSTCARTGNVCDGSWLPAALEVLSLNNISREYFSQRVLKALRNGRGKGNNMMICGPSNAAKSFLLMPLDLIYKVFFQPSGGSYNWMHAPDAEVIFLNDICYEENGDKEVLPWRQFLNLLEGCTVNVARACNLHNGDFAWSDASAPVFLTAETPIVRIRHGCVVPGETEQIQQRLGDIIYLKHQFLGENVKYDIVSCKRCFAELLLLQ